MNATETTATMPTATDLVHGARNQVDTSTTDKTTAELIADRLLVPLAGFPHAVQADLDVLFSRWDGTTVKRYRGRSVIRDGLVYILRERSLMPWADPYAKEEFGPVSPFETAVAPYDNHIPSLVGQLLALHELGPDGLTGAMLRWSRVEGQPSWGLLGTTRPLTVGARPDDDLHLPAVEKTWALSEVANAAWWALRDLDPTLHTRLREVRHG